MKGAVLVLSEAVLALVLGVHVGGAGLTRSQSLAVLAARVGGQECGAGSPLPIVARGISLADEPRALPTRPGRERSAGQDSGERLLYDRGQRQ